MAKYLPNTLASTDNGYNGEFEKCVDKSLTCSEVPNRVIFNNYIFFQEKNNKEKNFFCCDFLYGKLKV